MRIAAVLALGLVLASPAGAAESCTPGHGLSDPALQALKLESLDATLPGRSVSGTYSLGSVRFFRQNIFPHRNHWLARQANRFHLITREAALSSAFTLEPGDPVTEVTRAEAERALRGKPFLAEAVVLVRQFCGNRIDLDVVVQDVWTLTPGVGVSRSGGDNETSVTLSDVNILGTGKSLSLEYFDDRDRSGTSLSYRDPNILGSRWAGNVSFADNDDGERYGFSVGRPFFSLDTRWSVGVRADHSERQQDLEFLGSDEFELDAETDTADVFFAHSTGRRSGRVSRLFAGVRYVEEAFTFPANFPGQLQTERKFVYPYLGWQLIEDNFVTRTNFERVGRTEDLKLGWSSYVELGWSDEQFGGEGDHLLSRGSLAYRALLSDRHLLSFSMAGSGRYDLDSSETEDLVIDARANYLWYQTEQWRAFLEARYVHTRNLSTDRQLTLGGDSGLRGYPSRYQPGDRSVVLTLEQRYYSNAYPFGLFRLGYAAFVDVGRAWFDDSAPAWLPEREGDHFGTLSNVGLGLRLESVRTRRDRVFHIDIARPLVDGPDVETWEITLSGKQRF